MHNIERDDVSKELLEPENPSAQSLFKAVDKLKLHIEQRHPGKPIVCEVVGSKPLELVIVIPGDDQSYTLQALRPLHRGEQLVLRRRGGGDLVEGWLYNCRKGIRDNDPPNLHLAGLKITQGIL
ncbi:MAG: hypothetical protein AB1717_08825 [Pseudomonadota bacterium]